MHSLCMKSLNCLEQWWPVANCKHPLCQVSKHDCLPIHCHHSVCLVAIYRDIGTGVCMCMHVYVYVKRIGWILIILFVNLVNFCKTAKLKPQCYPATYSFCIKYTYVAQLHNCQHSSVIGMCVYMNISWKYTIIRCAST